MVQTECVHCERLAEIDEQGLCPRCRAIPSVVVLYLRRRGWTPAWEAHLRELTRRAQAGLPLFEQRPASCTTGCLLFNPRGDSCDCCKSGNPNPAAQCR